MKIQFLGSHTITLPVIQASSTQKTRNAMKDLATNTRDKPSQIFAQDVSQCDVNVQALLPREENRKHTIRYQRPTPPVPATNADVRCPEEYTTTNSSCNTTTARMQKCQKQKQSKNNYTHCDFRGIVNMEKIYCDFFSSDFCSTDATHTYDIILNTDTISILIHTVNDKQ
jgi:hypothetical protein